MRISVNWTCQRRRLANQARMSLVLWLAALSIDVDVEFGRNVPLDFIKELAELPRAVAQIYWLALCPLQWDGKCISPVPSVSIL